LRIDVRPGDTVMDVIGQARAAARAVEEEAQKNPLGLLKKEMNRIKQAEQQMGKDARAARQQDSLRFLYDQSHDFAKAADKILGSEDLFLAAAARFGEDSAEVEALRQVAAQRLFTGTLDPLAKFEKMSPEVQKLIFRMNYDEAVHFIKDMRFLTGKTTVSKKGGSESGSSIMATSKVTHPLSGGGAIGKFLTGPLGFIPGVNPAARGVLSQYYDLQKAFWQSPSFQRWVLKGLKGDDQAREVVRATVQRMTQRGGAVGAGVGESQFQTAEPVE
jgi:hypothetical protein